MHTEILAAAPAPPESPVVAPNDYEPEETAATGDLEMQEGRGRVSDEQEEKRPVAYNTRRQVRTRAIQDGKGTHQAKSAALSAALSLQSTESSTRRRLSTRLLPLIAKKQKIGEGTEDRKQRTAHDGGDGKQKSQEGNEAMSLAGPAVFFLPPISQHAEDRESKALRYKKYKENCSDLLLDIFNAIWDPNATISAPSMAYKPLATTAVSTKSLSEIIDVIEENEITHQTGNILWTIGQVALARSIEAAIIEQTSPDVSGRTAKLVVMQEIASHLQLRQKRRGLAVTDSLSTARGMKCVIRLQSKAKLTILQV